MSLPTSVSPLTMNPLKSLPLLAVLAALLVPAGAQAASPGVNIAGAPTPDRVSAAIATGAKTVRMFALWKDFEPDARGEYPSRDVNLLNTSNTYDAAIRQLNAAGVKPLFVVTSAPAWANGSSDSDIPPNDPADFGDFLRRFAAHNAQVGPVAGYEVWNEPDENVFWHPGPDPVKYTAMLKAAYAGIKAGDPSAVVVAGPTTGNDYNWLESLYAAGAQGSFDVVSVHTDTSCLASGPDQFYRENGKLAQYTFLGYRTVHDTMAAHGDGGKPIWMSELGWSSTNGGPTSCTRGMWTNQKPSGVSEADQATYLTKAYSCLANDPYVQLADWFTLSDTATEPVDELNHYGLLRTDGSAKPALNAFKAVAQANGGSAGSCGDFDPPSVRIVSPAPGEQFVDKLDISAAASDSGVGIARITFTYDNNQQIRNYTAGIANDKPVGLSPWQGSGKLAVGPHTIQVTALDKNGNTTTKSVSVVKVRVLKATLTPKFKFTSKKITCKKRQCTLKGSLTTGATKSTGPRPSIGGKVSVEWQFRNKKGKWRKLIGGLKPANKAFTFKAKAKFKGKWRVRTVYAGQGPYKKTTSKFVTFTVK
jgi:hypothetical protein